jgi:UDP-N-acetyl-D-galactosamine dehydrogenase
LRNSKVADIVQELRLSGVEVHVSDPLAVPDEARHEYAIELLDLTKLPPADAIVLAVAHDQYKSGGWPMVSGLLKAGGGIVLDVKSVLDRSRKPDGIDLWRL